MEDIKTTYIVTERPPWYLTSDYKEVFTCETTHGLFDKVVDLMICKQEGLSEREKRYKPKNIYKTIRNMAIRDADTIQQNPSRSLLFALIDLVDIEGGNNFESMATVDKAGLKHVLLAYSNYNTFYIPTTELTVANGKKVIPVVTQYSDKHNFVYYDSSRSMVGTYIVVIPTTEKGNTESYFVQEVLSVPGLESLELLKRVTGDRFEFWDMTLEVPTHSTALTPSFQQIQPVQLLRTEDKAPSTQNSNEEALASHMEEITPMCCVLGTASADMLKKKRDASADWFTENQVICDLKHFHYENGDTRTIYFRRSGKFLDGKRVNLVPVVVLRKGQAQAPELYVSTTLRFCRAMKQCCVKGNGGLVSCWNAPLKKMGRETFITGTDMYQEIHHPALTAFIKCVNPNSWCNYIPKHVESMITDPIMVEVVELAIRFMENKIPSAFAVAELLYCPLDKVREYLTFWNVHSSDSIIHTTVTKKRISMVEEQMRMDWVALADIVSRYVRKRYGDGENTETVSACEELFKDKAGDNIAKAQRMWHTLIKHDTGKPKDKDFVQTYATVRVLFLKLCTYHNRLKKALKLGEGERCDTESGSASPTSTEAQDTDVSSKCLAEVEEHIKDEATTSSVSEKHDSLYSIVTPESIPILTWIKNMSTLLLSEPWLNDDHLRREAICTILGLDNTLLDSRYGGILREWVINNRTVVNILKTYGLQDRLSKALVDCLESMSTDNWRRKVLVSFQRTRDNPRARSDQLVSPPRSTKMNPIAQGSKSDMCSKSGGKRAKKQAPSHHHPTAVKREPSASKSNKSSASKASGSKSGKKACDVPAHSSRRRYSHNDNHPWLSEAEEANSEEEECLEEFLEAQHETLVEDLEATMNYDKSEMPDEYNYSNDFIDDTSTEEEYSSEEEDEEAFCVQVQSKAKKAKCMTSNVNRRRKYRLVSSSESEEDKYSLKPTCRIMKDEGLGYKRALQSDSDDSIKPDAKRVKRTKVNRKSDKSEEKPSKSAKVVNKETSIQPFDREYKTPAKKRRNKSDKRCERVRHAKNTGTHNRDSPRYKKKLSSDSDTDDYNKGEEKCGTCIKGANRSKIQCTRSPVIDTDTDSEQEDIRVRKKTKSGKRDNTPRQKQGKTEAGRSLDQQEALKKQDLSNHPGSTSSHQSLSFTVQEAGVKQRGCKPRPQQPPRLYIFKSGPCLSQSKRRELSREAANVTKFTDQAAWPSDTLQQQSTDHEGERELDCEEQGLHREDNHPVEATSAAESEEDLDFESDFNNRLYNSPERSECSEDPESDFGENEYLVSM